MRSQLDISYWAVFVRVCLFYRMHRRRVRLIEGNAKSLRLKSDRERDFAAAVYLYEAPYPARVLVLGRSSTFVCS
jgi:hypothetical protein